MIKAALRERPRISSQGASGLGLPRVFVRRSSKSRLYFEGSKLLRAKSWALGAPDGRHPFAELCP